MARQPDSILAARVLPKPLYRALTHVFAQGVSGCMLVGGTALAGYYAGHRRSDDIDLFTTNPPSQRAAVLAIRSLVGLGAQLHEELSSAQFFSATCDLDGHHFTAQVVLDSNLFAVGSARTGADAVAVADLDTLLKQKAATLVSRCGEKDLYDLRWLFRHYGDLDLSQLIELGARIDGGINAESLLISLAGTSLRESACDFSTSESPQEVFKVVSALKHDLELGFEKVARGQPVPAIGKLIRLLPTAK